MDALNQLLATFKVQANVFHNGQYCGRWAVDTSGSKNISFHVVTHGRCYLSVADAQTEALEAGDMVFFPHDHSHCITSDVSFSTEVNLSKSKDYSAGIDNQGTGLVCGYFEHQHPMVEHAIKQLPDMVLIRRNDHNQSFSLLMQTLINESSSSVQGADYILNRIAEALLAMVFRYHLPQDQGVLAAALHPKLSKVLQAIHSSPQTKWTVDELAAICHLSRAAFAELFKDVLNSSPMEYVTQWRLSIAYRMLADDSVSTLEAALAVGYDNESSFSKAFKRVMGVTPGAVRSA
ncbi:AraC family transcriptional regulator [Simiduia litorea]|uniref:AraC family transcriptional regulator n=1 Tax=Simiduia litorea TaxID=1435348 RepID=UPI0036F3CB98